MSDPAGKIIRVIARTPGALLAKTKITPNQVTFLGLLVNCAVAFFIAKGNLSYLIVGILIWIAGFFDALDGSVARATGTVTVFGKFWDSVLDRYSDSVIYFGILVYFSGLGRMDYVLLTVIAIVGSLLVSYTRARAESLDVACEVGLLPRTVRIIILGAGFCINQVFWALLIIAVFSHLTVFMFTGSWTNKPWSN
jgi:CDP-diacylglycerol--glycerol-3-phosphate 3-phosphatidyltransferase